ncbi:MAG TPA: alpha/beta hydrolase [Candidatus Fournierella excrementigallinarum]|nr:alpha/beta hydrolase [Candidatus Fournierella excrementigallinarum]
MEYPGRTPVRVDEYPLLDGARHPFAVICPGGGYEKISDPLEGEGFARRLNGLGCAAFGVRYSVGRAARFPAPLEDAAAAVRGILARAEELNVDPADYSVWGASAGGHLAALFASEAQGWKRFGLPRPAALVLCYPVVTMEEPLAHAGSRLRLLGADPGPALVERTSAEKLVTAAWPPTFLWWGEADATVDPANSRMLLAALEAAGVRCEHVSWPGVGHGVGLSEGLPCAGWLRRAAEFWRRAVL